MNGQEQLHTCVRCKNQFAHQGIAVSVHGEDVGRVCPECLSGATEVRLLLQRTAPGKFILKVVDLQFTE